MMVQKGGQLTKPIIVMKMPGYKLLYIIQVQGFSWPYLISKILVTYNYSYNTASDWPRTFFTARLFLFSILYTYINAFKHKHISKGINIRISTSKYPYSGYRV